MSMNLNFEKIIKISENEILSELCQDFACYGPEVRDKFIMKLLKFACVDHFGKPLFNTTVDVVQAESLLQELVWQLLKSWSSDKEMRKRFAKIYDMIENIHEDNFWEI